MTIYHLTNESKVESEGFFSNLILRCEWPISETPVPQSRTKLIIFFYPFARLSSVYRCLIQHSDVWLWSPNKPIKVRLCYHQSKVLLVFRYYLIQISLNDPVPMTASSRKSTNSIEIVGHISFSLNAMRQIDPKNWNGNAANCKNVNANLKRRVKLWLKLAHALRHGAISAA